CGQPNVLKGYSSNVQSDEALFLDAKNKLDSSDWDSAISIITTSLSASYQARTDVKETLMYAYGGKCGISFLNMVNSLKSVSSTKMFVFALSLFAGSTVNLAACDNAYATLVSLGAASTRTNNENLFAAILGLTEMGATLHSKFDTDLAGAGDGIVDAGWDSCTISTVTNKLSDAEVNRIVAGIGLIFENITALGSALSAGTAGTAFTAAKTLCETPIALPAIGTPASYGGSGSWTNYGLPASPQWTDFAGLPADFATPLNCLNTDPAAVTDKMRRIFRRMISSSTQGFGTCDITNVTASVNTSANPLSVTITSNCCPALVSP
ncbi:MAG: hypothetical protein ACXVCN_19710, partial [Bdellovibrio sp.]